MKKLFWIVGGIIAAWLIFQAWRKQQLKKRIQLNPELNNQVQAEAIRNNRTYAQQLEHTARFMASNTKIKF